MVTIFLHPSFLADFSISSIFAGVAVFGPTIHRSRIFLEAALRSFSRCSLRRAAMAFAVMSACVAAQPAAENLDLRSGDRRPTINVFSWDDMKGLGRKCHPSLRTSIPPVKPDMSSTLIVGRAREI